MRNLIEGLEPRRLFAAGDIDPTFGVGGAVSVDTPFAFARPSLLDAGGGKVLAVGLHTLERRSAADGSLDTSFGNSGRVDLPADFVKDVKVRANGDIVVAGGTNSATRPPNYFVARYHADGSPDATFGTNGVVQLDDILTDQFPSADDVAIQSDGSIVVRGGGAGPNHVFRLTPGGALDTTFTQLRYTSVQDPALGVLKVLPDDRILIGGTRGGEEDLIAIDHGNRQFTLARLDPDGALDTDFGDNGFFTEIAVNDLAVLPDGSVLTVSADGAAVLVFAKLTADGDLFPGFGTSVVPDVAPRVLIPTGAAGMPTITLDGSGHALVNARGTILRVDPDNAALDETFGRVTASRAGESYLFEGAFIRADGKILLAVSQEPFTDDNALFLLQVSGTTPGPISFSAGTVSVTGSSGNDEIFVERRNAHASQLTDLLRVHASNSFGRVFDLDDVDLLSIDAQAGDDIVITKGVDLPAVIFGGLGNDRIAAGEGNDTIFGNAGNDRIDAGEGDDRIDGNTGHDKLNGQAGNDRLFGGAGHDFLAGGADVDRLDGGVGNDHLDGGLGADNLHGNDGDDLFTSFDNAIDDIYGGGGNDTVAGHDSGDLFTSIETVID